MKSNFTPYLLVIFFLSGCASTKLDFAEDPPLPPEIQFPQVSITVNDGKVNSNVVYTAQGPVYYEDGRPQFIYNVIKNSGLFEEVRESSSSTGYVLDIKYSRIFNEDEKALNRKMWTFALTAGVLPQKHKMQSNMKVHVRDGRNLVYEFEYVREAEPYVTVLKVDPYVTDKQMIKDMLNRLFRDLVASGFQNRPR